MTEILLIRHAYTLANNANWNQQSGIRDFVKEDSNCPIDNKYGYKQALELGEFLKQYLKNKKILWLMSPYYRVMQTSNIASNGIPNIQFKIIEDLREINQGLAYARNSEQLLIELKKHNLEALNYKEIINPYPLGESELDVKNRVKSLSLDLKEYVKNYNFDTIIIFSHETVNKWIYFWLNDKEIGIKQKTTEIISSNDGVLYSPTTMVPKGYIIDLKEYNMETEIERKKILTKKFSN